MARNLLSIVLWMTFLLFLGQGDAHILNRRADDDLPSVVFRGDLRIPEEIKNAGGFFPWSKTRGPMNAKQLETGSSLYQHHAGKAKYFTQYVSTTTDPAIGKRFGTPFKVGQQGQKAGYLYRISADPKMVDVVKSLGAENMHQEYVNQAEQAVVDGVPFDQIEGWYDLKEIEKNEAEILQKLKNGDKMESIFIKNEQFDAKYIPLRGSGAQPQLAGFGTKKASGSAAWEKEPWSNYKGTKVTTHLSEFRAKIAADVKVPEGATVSEEIAAFTEADPAGVRDLIGALDTGDVREGLMSVRVMEATREAEVVEATVELEAAEEAEALEATEFLATAEVAEAAEGVAVVEEAIELLAALLL